MDNDKDLTDFMNYNEIVEKALKGVVREALNRAAATGLPGNHHFYISFATNFPQVEMPAQLKDRYPKEITIVLQHEFWDLDINDTGFSVILSFNNKRELICVPWAAITGFADPSVQFGLQFNSIEDIDIDLMAGSTVNSAVKDSIDEAPRNEKDGLATTVPAIADVVELDQFRKK